MDYKSMYENKCDELEKANGIIKYYTEWYTQYSDDINLAEMTGLEKNDGAEITMRRIAGDYMDKIKCIEQLQKTVEYQKNEIVLLNNKLLEYINEIKNTYNKYIQLKTENEKKTRNLEDLQKMILEWDEIMKLDVIDMN
jgi:hypothetical protein